MRKLVEREAVAAAAALPSLDDAAVGPALERAARLLEERVGEVLAANGRDVEAAASTLDEGGLDRLRLDEQRVATLARQLETTAALEPLEREISSRTLANGLNVRELRIPVGTIGANFEARPGVALDIAAQVLKSLNTIVLRTGGAALATVETLVDQVLRPALVAEGIDAAAVGLVRSADRSGAEALVSVPRWIPLVILRGSGASTAALARLAADHGVRTLAHAEGGGVLYVHGSARADRVTAIVDASLDRLGVCNRLNLALVDREASGLAADVVAACEGRGVERGRNVACSRGPAGRSAGRADRPRVGQ